MRIALVGTRTDDLLDGLHRLAPNPGGVTTFHLCQNMGRLCYVANIVDVFVQKIVARQVATGQGHQPGDDTLRMALRERDTDRCLGT